MFGYRKVQEFDGEHDERAKERAKQWLEYTDGCLVTEKCKSLTVNMTGDFFVAEEGRCGVIKVQNNIGAWVQPIEIWIEAKLERSPLEETLTGGGGLTPAFPGLKIEEGAEREDNLNFADDPQRAVDTCRNTRPNRATEGNDSMPSLRKKSDDALCSCTGDPQRAVDLFQRSAIGKAASNRAPDGDDSMLSIGRRQELTSTDAAQIFSPANYVRSRVGEEWSKIGAESRQDLKTPRVGCADGASNVLPPLSPATSEESILSQASTSCEWQASESLECKHEEEQPTEDPLLPPPSPPSPPSPPPPQQQQQHPRAEKNTESESGMADDLFKSRDLVVANVAGGAGGGGGVGGGEHADARDRVSTMIQKVSAVSTRLSWAKKTLLKRFDVLVNAYGQGGGAAPSSNGTYCDFEGRVFHASMCAYLQDRGWRATEQRDARSCSTAQQVPANMPPYSAFQDRLFHASMRSYLRERLCRANEKRHAQRKLDAPAPPAHGTQWGGAGCEALCVYGAAAELETCGGGERLDDGTKSRDRTTVVRLRQFVMKLRSDPLVLVLMLCLDDILTQQRLAVLSIFESNAAWPTLSAVVRMARAWHAAPPGVMRTPMKTFDI